MNWPLPFVAACAIAAFTASASEPRFEHHFISRDLPSKGETGDYGLTSLVDLDKDGDLDFVLGGRGAPPGRLYWYEFQGPDQWVQHIIGTNYQSDVGLAALDVDHDGWPDLVCSGVWFRNPRNPRTQPFERIVFATNASGAHDILVADVDGDKRPDILMMGDSRTALNSLRWYSIPENPRDPWTSHLIGPPIHGAITPAAAGDIDGDGDLDIVRGDAWFENVDGKGLQWQMHSNIPMGRKGPFGVCVRAAVLDIDGDGHNDIVMCDADITDCKIVILKNVDGRGGQWLKQPLPQSFKYGSLHALALADFNGDGRLDIVSNEQEELLPDGRQNPRWILWENLGGGKFVERIILDTKLGGHELQVGDVDGDGKVDICSKPWGPRSWNGNAGRMHVDFLKNITR
jgi:hypothetical protein